MTRAAAVALVVAAAAGCGAKINQAGLGVATDLPTAMLDGVSLILATGSTTFATGSFPIGGDSTFILPGLIDVYTTGDALPEFDVTVVGTLGGNEQLRRRVRATLLPEQTRFVRLALESACLGVACDDDQSCVEGACQPIDVDLSLALPYFDGEEAEEACGDPMFLYSFDDTPLPPPTTDCTSGQLCIEGTCYQPPGAAPVAGPGEYATGTFGDFQVPAS